MAYPLRRTTMRILIATAAIVLAGCSSEAIHGAPVPGTSGPVVSTRLELDSTTVRSGGELSGRILLNNHTGGPIKATGCGGIFQVHLTNEDPRTRNVVWPACAQPITIPVGTSTVQVQLEARYPECSTGIGDVPCVGQGTPPLPPGRYVATTFEIGGYVPTPPPVAVEVTP